MYSFEKASIYKTLGLVLPACYVMDMLPYPGGGGGDVQSGMTGGYRVGDNDIIPVCALGGPVSDLLLHANS